MGEQRNGKLSGQVLAGALGAPERMAVLDALQRTSPVVEDGAISRDSSQLSPNGKPASAPRPKIPLVASNEIGNTEWKRLLAQHPFVVAHSNADPSRLNTAEAEGFLELERQKVPLALFRGQFSFPIIRVDDYPTGVRPILKDRRPLMDVVEAMEAMDYPYHLGISPGLLSRSDIAFLKTCKNMVPSLHGFDHNYWKYATKLINDCDEFNSKVNTVWGSILHRLRYKLKPHHQSEYYEMHPDLVYQRIELGKERLEDDTGKPVTVFTATFDRPPPTTKAALEGLGFSAYFSQNAVPECEVPWITADFYGTSRSLDPDSKALCICLHTLWEWDLVRRGGTHELNKVGNYARKTAAEFETSATAIKGLIQSPTAISDTPSPAPSS